MLQLISLMGILELNLSTRKLYRASLSAAPPHAVNFAMQPRCFNTGNYYEYIYICFQSSSCSDTERQGREDLARQPQAHQRSKLCVCVEGGGGWGRYSRQPTPPRRTLAQLEEMSDATSVFNKMA